MLSRFLCQVLNQTWDLLGFFMFTSPISSKQSDLTIPLPFQTAKQSAKQPQLSKNEANWMGISIWAWPLTLFRTLNSLVSSLGSSKESLAFQQSCSLIWPLPAGFQRCTACSREDSWMPPEVTSFMDSNWIPKMQKWCAVYGLWPKPCSFAAFLYLSLRNYGICSILTLSTGWHGARSCKYAAFWHLALPTVEFAVFQHCEVEKWVLINVYHSISIFTHLSLSFLTLSCLTLSFS